MSLRKAIDAKCTDCIYDPLCGGGTWREQIAQCSCVKCPLWPVRPAPSSGPFAGPPRSPEAIPPGWLTKPVGLAVSGHPSSLPAMIARPLRVYRKLVGSYGVAMAVTSQLKKCLPGPGVRRSQIVALVKS